MYEKLVKRLRELPHLLFVQLHGNEDVVYQAADAIEELQKQVEDYECKLEISPEAEYAIDKHCNDIISRMDKLIKGLDDKPRWISVEERLPEKAEQIADHWFSAEVIGKDEVTIRKAYYNFTAGVWLDANCEMEWDSITHWMPMPPKEET